MKVISVKFRILVGLESLLENARFLKAEFIYSFVLRRKK